ncbi:four and a half LIM domains protein 2-like [Symsagittifera roscoffensis]|uniref:four and a half LIM domains protein 2-like n=1 Tax=Symsagittifera roscoffensis TaxID=84072 RepID=UPI00307C69D3
MSRAARRRPQIPSDSEEEEMSLDKKMSQKFAGKAEPKADNTATEQKPRVVTNNQVASNNQNQDFCCWKCDKSLYGCRFVNKDAHPYCVKCYNEEFANTCFACKEIISVDQKDLAFKDKHWHEKCFKCSECKKPLKDQSFGFQDGQLYCSECWDNNFAPKCTKCQLPFKAGSMKLSWNGGEYHKECFCCAECDKVIGQEAFHPQEGKPYCEDCWEKNFAIKCSKCSNPIKQGGVTYKLEPYHKECFTCFECDKSLAGQRFTLKDDKPICPDCYGKLYAQKCFDCGEAITGMGGNRYIIFEDMQWHTNCFHCKDCQESLVGINFVAEGYGEDLEIFCQPHGFQKRGMDFTTIKK